ncbi:MAG: hypothetical protein ACFB2Z_06615 [Maricaulaceae bacterium]
MLKLKKIYLLLQIWPIIITTRIIIDLLIILILKSKYIDYVEPIQYVFFRQAFYTIGFFLFPTLLLLGAFFIVICIGFVVKNKIAVLVAVLLMHIYETFILGGLSPVMACNTQYAFFRPEGLLGWFRVLVLSWATTEALFLLYRLYWGPSTEEPPDPRWPDPGTLPGPPKRP